MVEKWWKRGGEGAAKGWPGGMRDGRILRFAEAGTDSAVGWSVWCSNTAEPDKGLAVFNRSAHSAGPGEWYRTLE